MSTPLEAYFEDTFRRVMREVFRQLLKTIPLAAANSDERVAPANAAAKCGLSVGTLAKLAKKGTITKYGSGRKVLYSLTEVLALRPEDAPELDAEAKAADMMQRSGQ